MNQPTDRDGNRVWLWPITKEHLVSLGWLWLAGIAALCGITASRILTPDLSSTQLAAIKLLFVAPAIEEIFFRGVVHAELKRCSGRVSKPFGAILVTAVAFGAAHLFMAPASHALAVMFPALFIGWVYERSRSIVTCALVHAAFNAVWLCWEWI